MKYLYPSMHKVKQNELRNYISNTDMYNKNNEVQLHWHNNNNNNNNNNTST